MAIDEFVTNHAGSDIRQVFEWPQYDQFTVMRHPFFEIVTEFDFTTMALPVMMEFSESELPILARLEKWTKNLTKVLWELRAGFRVYPPAVWTPNPAPSPFTSLALAFRSSEQPDVQQIRVMTPCDHWGADSAKLPPQCPRVCAMTGYIIPPGCMSLILPAKVRRQVFPSPTFLKAWVSTYVDQYNLPEELSQPQCGGWQCTTAFTSGRAR